MIICGELRASHKARLAALSRDVKVHVMPRGGVTSPGLRTLKTLAKTFARHQFLLVVRWEWLQDPEVTKAWDLLDGVPNIHADIVRGGASGTEIGKRYAALEKRASAAAEVEPAQNKARG